MPNENESESDIYTRLEKLRRTEHIGQDQIDLMRSAISNHPQSGRMWILFGDLLQLATIHLDIETEYDIPDCYNKAIEIDPGNIEAWTELGCYYDTNRDNFKNAEGAFDRAIALGGSADAYSGLARVVAQLGRQTESLALLSEALLQYPGDENIIRRKREIESGEWDPV